MFSNLFSTVKRWYTTITAPLQRLFSRTIVDEEVLHELKVLLLEADVSLKTTLQLIDHIKKEAQQRSLTGQDLQNLLRQELLTIFATMHKEQAPAESRIIFLVGINGSGKTTTAAKLAHQAITAGKRVLLVAADTFRAAATEQLSLWAHELGVELVQGVAGSDPSAVIFRGCEAFKKGSYDLMIIDTAGRVQTKMHLMEELAKMRRVLHKQLPLEKITTLLTIDSMLGQNSLQQAQLFNEATSVDALILTKCDGTGKGGIVITIVDELKIPIQHVTTGEALTQIAPFSSTAFIDELLGISKE